MFLFINCCLQAIFMVCFTNFLGPPEETKWNTSGLSTATFATLNHHRIWLYPTDDLHCPQQMLRSIVDVHHRAPQSPQNKHVVENIKVPSVKMFYPDEFHQDHSSSHDSRVGQDMILLQAKVKLDWPPWAPDMNTVENTWSEAEDSAGNGPVLPPRSSDELRTFQMKLLCHSLTLSHWIHDMTSEISGQSTGIPDILINRSVLENSPFKGQSINSHFVCANEILQ